MTQRGRIGRGRGGGEGRVGVKGGILGENYIIDAGREGGAKAKTLWNERGNEGAVGFLECVLVWSASGEGGGNTVPQNL